MKMMMKDYVFIILCRLKSQDCFFFLLVAIDLIYLNFHVSEQAYKSQSEPINEHTLYFVRNSINNFTHFTVAPIHSVVSWNIFHKAQKPVFLFSMLVVEFHNRDSTLQVIGQQEQVNFLFLFILNWDFYLSFFYCKVCFGIWFKAILMFLGANLKNTFYISCNLLISKLSQRPLILFLGTIRKQVTEKLLSQRLKNNKFCLLYTSPSPRD